jgi:hypothetical protein
MRLRSMAATAAASGGLLLLAQPARRCGAMPGSAADYCPIESNPTNKIDAVPVLVVRPSASPCRAKYIEVTYPYLKEITE